MKLLILDDDIQIREGVEKSIDWRCAGIDEVKSAGDGVSGLKMALSFRPDIILSDVRMPGINGLDFLREIKEVLPRSKVILISGYDDFEYLQKAVKYKADAYELKPVKVQHLINLVAEMKEEILRENAAPAQSSEPPRYTPKIMKAVDYINAHFDKPITTAALSKTLGLTPNYFSAVFKRETGISFNAYLNNVRLKSAAYLLEHTSLLIYEIADQCGFHDYIYFSQVFKKAYNCSPRAYRTNKKQPG
ncbi:MAG: response regulator [Spirochaetaceae bacterium]|jgi:YesN/AraC family two-component response regulator|nr:response regulator [Spirochaetaceae bacterium]